MYEDEAIVESVHQLKETNHNLKLNDAILRNKIRKHERDIDTLKQDQEKVKKELVKIEKQHKTDF